MEAVTEEMSMSSVQNLQRVNASGKRAFDDVTK